MTRIYIIDRTCCLHYRVVSLFKWRVLFAVYIIAIFLYYLAFTVLCFRLTPTVFAVVLFHATLLRHLGNGPNWNQFVGTEYLKCRKNWWNNLLYINNWVDPYNMVCILWLP